MKRNLALNLLGIACVLALWSIVSYTGLIKTLLFPSPSDAAVGFVKYVTSRNFPIDFAYTLTRTVVGFLIAATLGIIIGLLMGTINVVYRMLEFVVDFVRSIPVSSILPVFLVFFGISELSKVAIVVWGASLIVAVNVIFGVRNVNQTRLKVARSFGATRMQTFVKFVLPEAIPHVYAGLRIAVSVSLMAVIVAEMFTGSKAGLGMRIYNTALLYQTGEMVACVAITGTIGYLLNRLFVVTEGRLLHWRGR
jgi:sulfonate transport system permease protein